MTSLPPGIVDPQVLHGNPEVGRQDLGRVQQGFEDGMGPKTLNWRRISSDMTEALHLADPGYFLCLGAGARYYIWRRTILKHLGRNLYTGQIYSGLQPFNLHFMEYDGKGVESIAGMGHITTYDLRSHEITDEIRRATYGYIYECWWRTTFGEDSAWRDFLHKTFFPMIYPSISGHQNLEQVIERNVMHHLDVAGWLWTATDNNKYEALAYLEGSVEQWSDPNFKFVKLETVRKEFSAADVYPYVLWPEENNGVAARDRISHWNILKAHENLRPQWEIDLEKLRIRSDQRKIAKEKETKSVAESTFGFMKGPVTEEETAFMEQLFDSGATSKNEDELSDTMDVEALARPKVIEAEEQRPSVLGTVQYSVHLSLMVQRVPLTPPPDPVTSAASNRAIAEVFVAKNEDVEMEDAGIKSEANGAEAEEQITCASPHVLVLDMHL